MQPTVIVSRLLALAVALTLSPTSKISVAGASTPTTTQLKHGRNPRGDNNGSVEATATVFGRIISPTAAVDQKVQPPINNGNNKNRPMPTRHNHHDRQLASEDGGFIAPLPPPLKNEMFFVPLRLDEELPIAESGNKKDDEKDVPPSLELHDLEPTIAPNNNVDKTLAPTVTATRPITEAPTMTIGIDTPTPTTAVSEITPLPTTFRPSTGIVTPTPTVASTPIVSAIVTLTPTAPTTEGFPTLPPMKAITAIPSLPPSPIFAPTAAPTTSSGEEITNPMLSTTTSNTSKSRKSRKGDKSGKSESGKPVTTSGSSSSSSSSASSTKSSKRHKAKRRKAKRRKRQNISEGIEEESTSTMDETGSGGGGGDNADESSSLDNELQSTAKSSKKSSSATTSSSSSSSSRSSSSNSASSSSD